MKQLFVSMGLLLLWPLAMWADGEITVTETATDGAFTLCSATAKATMVVDNGDAEVVRTAAMAVRDDLMAITGKILTVKDNVEGGDQPVIAGTLGQSAFIDALAAAGKIDVQAVQGKWECFGLQLVDHPMAGIERALVIYGSTPRGTAYGLFHLSRLMGVSPYIWWADVAPVKRSQLYVTGVKTLSKEPSVKYRGIFINDEDFCLQPWAAKGIDSQYDNIGPHTYAKVMELLLRLRANTLWPAMHLSSQAFWDNKDNLPVAKKYDIMLGSSHCEQMLRDNEWEWRHAPYSGTNEDWNYVTNKEKIQRYWRERVVESSGYDAMYTLGMRGVHDWGISGYPSTEDKVRGLTEIIDFQRSLIRDHIGEPATVPQLFIPYKEVLDAYNAGLQVPEDVTLCWVDDNHGYIRQLPVASEQARRGGNGVYYHLSYWGTPADYLWICSHSPSLISYELSRAWHQGVQTLWVINVGDIKPAEAELEFCMDLAWDIDAWTPEKAHEYSRYWAAETFGEQVADSIAAIKREYYRLAAGGKPEHVFGIDYTWTEKDQRMADYQALADKVDAVKKAIPDALQDAYFQLIEYPVKGAAHMNTKIFRAAQSRQLADTGQRDQALLYAAEARKAYQQISDLTDHYNTGIAGGKWNGMMNFHPRNLSQFNMPETATLSNVSVSSSVILKAQSHIVPATAYTASSGNFSVVEGLGVSDHSVTVWPLDMTRYTLSQLSRAPWVEYDVPVKTGKNTIRARFLPTFPINKEYDLRVVVSIDGVSAQEFSLKTVAMEGKWNKTVMQGYNDTLLTYTATEDKTVKVRVYMLDPGVVLSDIYILLPEKTEK